MSETKETFNKSLGETPKYTKGDKVTNPITKRPVAVGSVTWKKLFKLGLVTGTYDDVNLSQLKNIEQSKLSKSLEVAHVLFNPHNLPVIVKKPRKKKAEKIPLNNSPNDTKPDVKPSKDDVVDFVFDAIKESVVKKVKKEKVDPVLVKVENLKVRMKKVRDDKAKEIIAKEANESD